MREILDGNYYFSNENLKKTFNSLVKTIAMTWFHSHILIISGVWTWFCTKTDWCNQPWHMNQDGDTTPTIRGNDLNDNEKLTMFNWGLDIWKSSSLWEKWWIHNFSFTRFYFFVIMLLVLLITLILQLSNLLLFIRVTLF